MIHGWYFTEGETVRRRKFRNLKLEKIREKFLKEKYKSKSIDFLIETTS